MPWVYLLRCRDGSLYAGATKDLERRFGEHQSGQASAYTRSRRPVKLVYSREVDDWSSALKEEHRLKTLTKAEKEALVRGASEPA